MAFIVSSKGCKEPWNDELRTAQYAHEKKHPVDDF